MRAFAIVFVVTFLVSCGGTDRGLAACLPDGSECTADEQCCGEASLDASWGQKLENVHGACKLGGKCCTWFETAGGWITLLCGGESVSFPPAAR